MNTQSAVMNMETYKREDEFPLRLQLMRWIGRQPGIPRGCDAVLRKLWHPDSGKHYRFDVDFFGKRYRGDLAHYIDWTVFCYGGAPMNELLLLRDVTEELHRQRSGPVTFYDVGANVGHHTLFMAGVADKVFAFEPFPTVRAEIEDKIAYNNLSNVQIVPVALGNKSDELMYYAGMGSNSGIGTFRAEHAESDRAAMKLPIRRGDELFAEMGLPKVDILKVDVEGFESQVLEGLRERILADRPVILMEMLETSDLLGMGAQGIRDFFYEGAVLAEVTGNLNANKYELHPFEEDMDGEIVIVPPEMAAFVQSRLVPKK